MGVVKDVVLSLPSLTKDGYGVGTSDPNKKSDSDDSDPSDLEEGIEATQDLVKEVTDKVGEDKESRKGNKELLAKLDEAAKAELEKLEKANEKKAADRKQIADDPVAFADDVREKLNKEREEFKKEMAGLNSKVADDKTIEKMLAKIQRDRAIMSVAVMIGKGGFTVAAKFFAPLSIGTEAIAMSMNIAAAVQRAADLRAFVDEKAGARNAVSPYMSSIQNFVDNQANQLTQYSIRIALNGANIAASVAATAYPMAAPAVTVVAAVQSATELIFSVYNENRLSKAWKATKLALDNPGNRRLGLKARKMNPTLAKYTIAYGATIERDPIAISMCDACGITKDALEKENVNAQKVKTFLEVKFEEDGKVVRHYEDKPDWSADIPDPQLKADCVFYTYKVINDGLGTTPEAAKLGKITPPTELLTMIRAVGTELADGAPSDAIEAQLLMMGRLVSGFAAEANRFGPLGEEAADAVAAFGDLADVKQQKLVLRLLKAKQDEATQTRPRSGGGSPPPPQRPPPPPPRN